MTYTKHVASILQKHCQGCHRAGEIGPMQLTTYEEVRPRAKSIRQAVLRKTMPPWHADPRYGHFQKNSVPVAAIWRFRQASRITFVSLGSK